MSVTKSFTAVGVSNEQMVPVGQSFSYDVSGTFVGTVRLERQDRRADWVAVLSATGAASGTIVVEAAAPGKTQALFRWRCSAFTSGTIVTAITELTSEVTSTLKAGDGTTVLEVSQDGIAVPSGKVLTATAPVLTSPKVTTPLGAVHAIERTFTETTAAGVYTGSVTVPAGATILDIIVSAVALWNPATTALMDVGDVTDPDGYFTQVDLKATDLLAGESISFAQAGGKAGAYIANSQVSPRYLATARVVSGIVTTVGASGTTGRTRMTVVYHLPVTADIVAATKVAS